MAMDPIARGLALRGWTDVLGTFTGSPVVNNVFWPSSAKEVQLFVRNVTQSGSGLLALKFSIDGQNFLNGASDLTIENPDGTETPTSALAMFNTATTLARSGRCLVSPANGAGPKGIFIYSRPLVARYDGAAPLVGAQLYSTILGNVSGGSFLARWR